jgi:hypothetical protein
MQENIMSAVGFEVLMAVTMKPSEMWHCVGLVRTNVSEEDGGETFLQNVSSHKTYTAPHPRRWHAS